MIRSRRFAGLAVLLIALLASCGEPEHGAGGSPTGTSTSAAPTSGTPAAGAAAASAWPATPLAALPMGTVISDQWYEVREDDRKSGWAHSVWTRSEFEGAPSIHDRTEFAHAETRDMAGSEDVFESETVSDLERTEDGMLLRVTTKTTQPGRTETSEVRREGDAYVSIDRVAGREERHVVATQDLVPVDTEAFLAPKVRRGEVSVGMKFSYPATAFLTGKLETVDLRVDGREDIATAAGSANCWRVIQTVAGRPGLATWWIDEHGVVARLRQGTSTTERTTESKARVLDASAATFSITMPARPELPRTTSLDRCVIDVEIDLRGGSEMPDFPATPFSKEVSREGSTVRVALTAYDDPSATIALPVTDPAVAKWLEDTNLYAPTHPKVKRALGLALREVPEDARNDGRTVARALLRYVFRTLRKASGPIPQPTAPEILDDGGGDCSEHAVLFVALCRAAGLPARRLTGYAQVGDMWGAHSFCEVWLGKWNGADPTTNELGTRARYLCFGWDEDADSYPGLVSQRCRGRMTIRTVEFTDAGRTYTIEEASKRKPLRDDRAGLVFAKPDDGWSVSIGSRVGTATVSGPGVEAEISVMAGVGDLDPALLKGSMFPHGRETTFGDRPALRFSGGFLGRGTTWAIPWQRRTLIVLVRRSSTPDATIVASLSKLLAPSFGE